MLKGAGGVEGSDRTHGSRTSSKLLAIVVLIDSSIDSDDSDATFLFETRYNPLFGIASIKLKTIFNLVCSMRKGFSLICIFREI